MVETLIAIRRAARFWAICMSTAAVLVAFAPGRVQATYCPPCGVNACMGPTGCTPIYSTFCYYGSGYSCQYGPDGCPVLNSTGPCGP